MRVFGKTIRRMVQKEQNARLADVYESPSHSTVGSHQEINGISYCRVTERPRVSKSTPRILGRKKERRKKGANVNKL